jgi:dienelactone hydrolase
VGGNFYVPSFFDTAGDRLNELGAAILRVNNRGHDQAYHLGARRLGAAYELLDDCRHDFAAWLDFASQRGYRRIAVWGHSLGAVKNVYVQATVGDPRVVCAVASSPPRFNHQAYLASEHGERFASDIAQAQQLVDAGEPQRLIEALMPQNRAFSARTFIDKYGPRARFDYFEYLAATPRPLLLTLGSLEREELNFAPLAQRGPTMNAEWPNVSFAMIDGADHSYLARAEPLWTTVRTWLERVAAPVAR